MNNILRADRVLSDKGFKETRIFYKTAKSEIFNFFKSIKQRLAPKDTLFIYMTGHGSLTVTKERLSNYSDIESYTRASLINTTDKETINEIEFSDLIKNIKSKKICVFDQCYGGGFARRASEESGALAISAGREDEITYGDFFSTTFFDSLVLPIGRKSEKISLKEAFEITLKNIDCNICQKQHPVILPVSLAEKIEL
ncbi:caspase family protein [Patescibacteria group bacterium]|nr:caspase family protein [Patescibacteria group bacterium]MCL5733697.1 caspase family protein [Patescibacteria group bacterium]